MSLAFGCWPAGEAGPSSQCPVPTELMGAHSRLETMVSATRHGVQTLCSAGPLERKVYIQKSTYPKDIYPGEGQAKGDLIRYKTGTRGVELVSLNLKKFHNLLRELRKLS